MIIQKSEQLAHIIARRFKPAKGNNASVKLPSDMHMDLLVAFHDEKGLDVDTFKRYDLEEILEYLEATHRYYLSEALNKINYTISELLKSKENLVGLHLVLHRIFKHFEEDLVQHMAEEEHGLFPYVRLLIKANQSGDIHPDIKDESVLHAFARDHDDQCETILEELINYLDKKIIDHPKCFSLTMLRNHLDFFRRDLVVHSRIEEEVLVPMSVELENRVLELR